MASNAEILALQAIGGDWGCDLVNTTAEYTPPPGYAIKSILVQEESVINSVSQWEGKGLEKVEAVLTSTDKAWIDATLATGALITTHDLYPISRITLTSGSVTVYFCKGPSTSSASTTTTD